MRMQMEFKVQVDYTNEHIFYGNTPLTLCNIPVSELHIKL